MPPYRQRSGGSPRAACGLLCAGRCPPAMAVGGPWLRGWPASALRALRRVCAAWACSRRPAIQCGGVVAGRLGTGERRVPPPAGGGGKTPFLGFPRTPFLTAAKNSPLYRQPQPHLQCRWGCCFFRKPELQARPAGSRPNRLVMARIRSASASVSSPGVSRHCQLPSAVPGMLMRLSAPSSR